MTDEQDSDEAYGTVLRLTEKGNRRAEVLIVVDEIRRLNDNIEKLIEVVRSLKE